MFKHFSAALLASIIASVVMLTSQPAFASAASATPVPVAVAAPEREYPLYGNDRIGDCTFASATDYIVTKYNVQPSDQEVRLDFYEAEGNMHEGLTVEKLFHFWASQGIDGYRELFNEYPTSQVAVEEAIARQHALMAEVHLLPGMWIGTEQMTAPGYHMIVIAGYSATGPTLVTWGFDATVSWQEWSEMALHAYSETSSTIPHAKAVHRVHPIKHHHHGRKAA